jgi:ABC-2 type transport system permease protein
MSRLGRIGAEFSAARRAFLRRRTAVFFTFFFPLLIVVIFGALIQTRSGDGGLFTEPPSYYVAGYLAVVVLFTPLSRVGSEVARHRDGDRFEKLATTPLTRPEWLVGQTLVNVAIIGLAGLLVLAVMGVLTGARLVVTPVTVALVALLVAVGVALFCGVGALLGSFADSQDGVIAASNGIALPLLFLSETFVPTALLPGWLPTWLSPLTYFSRGVRAVATSGNVSAGATNLGVLAAIAVALFFAGALALPRTD